MNAAKQLAGSHRPGIEANAKRSTVQMAGTPSSSGAAAPHWWNCHWPLLTAVAWVVLLVTIGTWWWLGGNNTAGQAGALGSATVQEAQPAPAPQISKGAQEGLAWNAHNQGH